ncbi:hypothetical protein SAMN05443144_12818 [Fodinibius roseus]|uniref:Uncharacterized protein n=1 Tax=Fodinibius roseus TaxID=1194090 RepID=A0A1M5JQV3_9BACT|nr:hypothetical protein [Fodinibius roseus]SHG42931.1 hypothetical protein SAMN05443144_12818 [Fodinibius roseus]
MKAIETRLKTYYKTGNYKGFYKTRESKMKLSGGPCTQLIFSNGYKEIIASGQFNEEALEKIFDKIDHYFASSSIRYQSSKERSFAASP